jgi:hypothetical protein
MRLTCGVLEGAGVLCSQDTWIEVETATKGPLSKLVRAKTWLGNCHAEPCS